MINRFVVLSAMKEALAGYEFSGVVRVSSPIISQIICVDREQKEDYLERQRDRAIGRIQSLPDAMRPVEIESALVDLARYWNEATHLFEISNNGVGLDAMAWSLIKMFVRESSSYFALLYRLHLLYPKDKLFDIGHYYHGMTLEVAHDLLIKLNLLTEERIYELEESIINDWCKRHNNYTRRKSYFSDEVVKLIEQAQEEKIIDKDFHLLKTMAEFVRLCVRMECFKPWGRPAFRPVSGLLIDNNGNHITENQLAQAYSDMIGKTKRGA